MRPDALVAGVVLAAGSSSRMGQNKLRMRVGGEALVARATGRSIAAGLDPVIVVLGHEAERVRQELEGISCRPVVNPLYAAGPASSLRAGVGAVPSAAAAAVVVLADMPHVTAEMIAATVKAFRESGAPLVISMYGGISAPPTLYGRELFAEIAEIPDEGTGRSIVDRWRARGAVVTWPADRLADLDVPADLARLGESVLAPEN